MKAIKEGRATTIQLGNLVIWRDWGWAPDYVQAMALMLQAEQPADLSYSAIVPARITKSLGWSLSRPIKEIVEKSMPVTSFSW